MSKIEDGGPAFPVPGLSNLPNGDFIHPEWGMTLRDYFAAKAMAALIPESFSQDDEHRPDVIADRAYWFADAMLAAREAS